MMKNKILATGEVHICVYENGRLINEIKESNLVVTLGLQNICRLMGGDAAGKKIEKISLGTNGTAPAAADAAITAPFVKAISSVSYPEQNSVLFSFEITNAEANGMTIREFGLLNTDNVLCARKVRTGEIAKTNAIALAGTWKITVN